MHYSSVDIIFNPNSTGPSGDYARELQRELRKLSPKLPVQLRRTEYTGHATEIAFECARASKNPLIISASGDGGYNEAINGAMRAQLLGARPICAVLAAGNANDHSRTLQEQSLQQSIIDGRQTSIDLLKATYTQSGRHETRYAHSYIGLGLTPVVAVELNKTNLNALKELWIVLKTFYKFRPFKVNHSGKVITLDSILFANIGEMAKVLTISKNAKPDDGLFEIITFPHSHKFNLLKRLAKTTVDGLEQSKHYRNYDFTVLKKMPIQFDGEVQFVDKGAKVRIASEHKILRTIL
jgi:diacylglycerol kinase family enzyme